MTAIDSEKYSKILNKNVSLDLYFLLSELNQGNPILNNPKVDGYLLLAQKKNWITPEGTLSDSAKELLAYINDDKVFLQEVEKKSQSFNSYCQSLFSKIENRIFELTGKKQFKNLSTENLKPSNPKELQDQLDKFIRKYNYRNLERIEEEILNHVDYAIKKREKYTRSIYYFIEKSGFPSELLKKVSTDDYAEAKVLNTDQPVHINTKELF